MKRYDYSAEVDSPKLRELKTGRFVFYNEAQAEIDGWEKVCNGHMNHIKKLKRRHNELLKWIRYEMEEAGADDKKDEVHNAKGVELLLRYS